MEELDLSQMISLFWHRKVQIILIVLIFMVIGVAYTTCFVTPKYTSSTTLVLAAGKDSTLPTSITSDRCKFKLKTYFYLQRNCN